MTLVAAPLANATSEREWLGARPVERPLVLSRGWAEVGVAWDHDRFDAGFGLDGRAVPWTDPIRVNTATASARWGPLSGVELFGSLQGTQMAVLNVSTGGVSSAEVGSRVVLVDSPLPLASLTAELMYRLPVGSRSPDTEQLASPTPGDLAFGRRASAFEPAIRFRRQFGAVRLDSGLQATLVLPSASPGVMERTDWADSLGVYVGGLLQIGPVALNTSWSASRWGDDRVGGDRIASAGWHVSGAGGAVVSINRGVDLVWTWRRVLRGRPTWFAGAVHVSQPKGARQHLGCVFRW